MGDMDRTTQVLVTGATGKTGAPLVRLLRQAGVPIRVASRHPDPDAVRFDWDDPATHGTALAGVAQLYLVLPPGRPGGAESATALVEAARAAGIRIVLLGAQAVFPGAAELYATVTATPGGVVLRPSGFLQNWTGNHQLAASIREHGVVRTASGSGRMGWLDADDIAAAAVAVLRDPGVAGELTLTGPESLSLGDLTTIVAEVTGRQIRLVPVSAEQRVLDLRAAGLSDGFAAAMATVETETARGAYDEVTTTVADLTGRAPRTARAYLTAHRDALA